jgi:hypothetical protein
MAINFGKAFGPNPAAELANALGSAVQQAPYQAAQLQAVGQQVLAQYKQMANADPNLASDPNFVAKVTRISKMYGLPVPMMGSEGSSWDAAGADQGQQPAQAQPAAAGAPAAPQGTPSPPQSKSPMPFGAPSPGDDIQSPGTTQSFPAGQLPQQDPKLAGRAQAYTQLLQQAAQNPAQLRDPSFHSALIRAAAGVGRGPSEVKADIAAYQQKAKSGNLHPALAPGGAVATAGAPPTAGQPAPGAATDSPQAASGTPPEGTESFMRPESEGPRRINLNAWLGRTMGAQEFGMYSQMTPDNRKQALRAAGYDSRDFDPKWLNSEPSLDPSHQLSLANDVSKTLNEAFKNGDSVNQVKTLIAPYISMLTPEQRAGIDAQAASDMNESLQIRLSDIQQKGLLRRQTIALMNRRLTDNEQNTSWDHNFKYQVFNQRGAEFSQRLQVEQQNARTSAARLQNEISQGNQPKMGELINTARGLLTSINSAVNEYNGRINDAIKAGTIDPKNPSKGVNPDMEEDIQNDIDAYNNIVTTLRGRGFNSFNFYSGADQSAMDANTAKLTAGSAVNAQGQATPRGAGAGSPPFTVPKGYQAKQINGQWGIVDPKTGKWAPWLGGKH